MGIQLVRLPKEAFWNLCSFLEVQEIGRLARTCQTIKNIIYNDNLWMITSERALLILHKSSNISYRELYIKNHHLVTLFKMNKAKPNVFLALRILGIALVNKQHLILKTVKMCDFTEDGKPRISFGTVHFSLLEMARSGDWEAALAMVDIDIENNKFSIVTTVREMHHSVVFREIFELAVEQESGDTVVKLFLLYKKGVRYCDLGPAFVDKIYELFEYVVNMGSLAVFEVMLKCVLEEECAEAFISGALQTACSKNKQDKVKLILNSGCEISYEALHKAFDIAYNNFYLGILTALKMSRYKNRLPSPMLSTCTYL